MFSQCKVPPLEENLCSVQKCLETLSIHTVPFQPSAHSLTQMVFPLCPRADLHRGLTDSPGHYKGDGTERAVGQAQQADLQGGAPVSVSANKLR